MKTENQLGRNTYKSSGKVDWLRFLPLAIAAWVVSAILAAFLYFLLIHGFYWIIIAPAIAALGAAGMVVLAVTRGRCRSRFVAVVTGVLAGVILYIGSYYVGMVASAGLANAHRLDFLPRYISYRMETDTDRKVGSSGDESGRSRGTGQAVMNWFKFAMEFGFALAIPTFAGLFRTRRAYCEKCDHWMEQEMVALSPGSSPVILADFHNGSLAAFLNEPVVAIGPNLPHTAVAVEFCKTSTRNPTPCPAFLSMKEMERGGTGQINQMDGALGKAVLRRAELTQAELVALIPKFPALQSAAGQSNPTSALKPIPGVPSPEPLAAESAEVIPVPAPFAGRLLTKKNILMNNLFAFIPVLALFGGLGLAFLGAMLAFPDAPSATPSITEKICGIIMIGVGIVAFAMGSWVGVKNISVFAVRRNERLARCEFDQRPARLVDPNATDSWFVEIVPRANWYRMMLESATDVGFLRIDTAQKEIQFDGDKECYRIPAGAILSCKVEEIVQGQETGHATRRYATVLKVCRDREELELPFYPLWMTWNVSEKKRAARAMQIQEQIMGLVPPRGDGSLNAAT